MNEQTPMKQPKFFGLSALAAYVIGYLWICVFLTGFHDFATNLLPWYPLVFTVCFFLWAGFTLREKAAVKEHWFWLGCALLIAVSSALNRHRSVGALGGLALHGFAAYWVLCRSGLLTDSITSAFLPYDLLETFVVLPFENFFLRIITLAKALGRKLSRIPQRDGSWKVTLAVVIVLLPVFLFAGKLLGQADDTFASIWNNLGQMLTFRWNAPRWVFDTLVRFGAGLPVGAYLFGLVGGAARRTYPRMNAAAVRQRENKARFVPFAGAAIVLTAFIAMYFLFFGIQIRHLLGAFSGIVPGKLTAAQYARQGFFQLTEVMAINFLLMAAVFLCSRKNVQEDVPMQWLGFILMVQNIFLAVTAAAKLWLYISRFGFTPLRLLSMWGILVMTAGCLLTIVSLRRKCGAIRKWVWFAAATFTVLSFY